MAEKQSLTLSFSADPNNPLDKTTLQVTKDMMALITAVTANPDKYKVILEANHPDTVDIQNQIQQMLSDKGSELKLDDAAIKALQDEVAKIQPQKFMNFVTKDQQVTAIKQALLDYQNSVALAKTLQNYVLSDSLSIALKKYASISAVTSLQNAMKTLNSNFKQLQSTSVSKQVVATLQGLVNSIKSTVDEDGEKDKDALTQLGHDINEILADKLNKTDALKHIFVNRTMTFKKGKYTLNQENATVILVDHPEEYVYIQAIPKGRVVWTLQYDGDQQEFITFDGNIKPNIVKFSINDTNGTLQVRQIGKEKFINVIIDGDVTDVKPLTIIGDYYA